MRWIIHRLIFLFAFNILLVSAFIGFGQWNPQGSLIAYTRTDESLNSDVILADILTGQTIELTHFTGDDDVTGRNPIWSTDGNRLAFWTYHNRSDTFAFELSLNDYIFNNLSEQSDYFSLPFYGVDNQLLYALSPTFTNTPIFLINDTYPDGIQLATGVLGLPEWSPDGQYVAYLKILDESEENAPSSGTNAVEIDMYIANVETQTSTNYTLNLDTYGQPAWSPDGTRIAMISRARNIGQIYIIDIASGDITEIPVRTRGLGRPVWSPDSSMLAFVDNVAENNSTNPEVMIMDMASYDVRNISNSPYTDAEPAWSPDSNSLIFTSRRNGQSEIYIANVDTGHLRRLTYTAYDETEPTWRPR